MGDMYQLTQELALVKLQLQRTLLEKSIITHQSKPIPIGSLTEQLYMEQDSPYMLMVLLSARPDPTKRLTATTMDKQGVTYYQQHDLETVVSVLEEELADYMYVVCFRAESDIGAIMSPKSSTVSDASILYGDLVKRLCCDMTEILSVLDMHLGFDSRVSISSVQVGRIDLYQLYTEACQARDYTPNNTLLVSDYNSICQKFRSISEQRLHTIERSFLDYLTQLNFIEAETSLSEFVRLHMQQGTTLKRLIALVNHQFHLVVIWSELQFDPVRMPNLSLQRLEHAVSAISQVNSFEELTKQLHGTFQTIAELFSVELTEKQGTGVRIMRFIEANCRNQSLSATNIAEHFQISPSYLSRLIRQECGMTFNACVCKLRLEMACELLLHTHLTIQQVSAQTGFGGRHYFSRVFRKEMGCTPSEYRAQACAPPDTL